MTGPLNVTLYTRPGCHLCDDAATMLRSISGEREFRLTVVDITADPESYDRFWADIPVVEIGDTVLRAPFELSELRRALAGSMREAL